MGVLTHGDVLKGLAEQGATLLVQQAMRSKLETASPADALDGALMHIHQNGCRVLMVVDNEKVVGLLTAGNVGELISMEAAGRQASIAKRPTGRWERWQLKPPTFGLHTAI